MISSFVDELVDLESLWTDDLCMSLDVDETFDRRKWKANLNNKSKLKKYHACLETLKVRLQFIRMQVHITFLIISHVQHRL